MTLGGDLECGLPHAIVSSNNHVVLERTDYVTVTQNQRRAGVRICAVFEFDDAGKITAWREYWDKAHCAEQMGFTVAQVQDAVRDRKSVVSGKSESVRVDSGGRRIINKKRIHLQSLTEAYKRDTKS